MTDWTDEQKQAAAIELIKIEVAELDSMSPKAMQMFRVIEGAVKLTRAGSGEDPDATFERTFGFTLGYLACMAVTAVNRFVAEGGEPTAIEAVASVATEVDSND